MAGETHKTTQTTRKQPKHNPLLLNVSCFTVSEHSYIYYIRCGNGTQQSDNDKTCFHLLHLFFPPPTESYLLPLDCWPLTIDYCPLSIDYSPLTVDCWLLTVDYWLWPLTVDHWPLTVDRWPLTIDRWPLTVDRWLLPHVCKKKMKEICNRVFVSYEESCTFARRLLSRRASKGLRLLVKRRQFYWPGTMSKRKARG